MIIKLYGLNIPNNAYDRSKKELKEFYSLYYCFGDYDSIFEKEDGIVSIIKYNRLMDGFSKFYFALKEAQKNYQFKTERKFFLFLKEIFEPSATIYNELKNLNIVRTEQDKENFKINKEELKKVQTSLESNIKYNDELIEYIKLQKDKIFANPSGYKIPYKWEGKRANVSFYKSMFCNNCYYNCHLNCKDLIKHFCKAFDFKFNCKVCPNKCPASEHYCRNNEWAHHEYKTFNQIFPKEIVEINNKDLKLESAIKYLEKEKDDFKGKIDELKKKIVLIDFELDDVPMDDIRRLNEKLVNEQLKFNDKYKSSCDFKESFEAEFFKLIIYNFLKLSHLYSEDNCFIWPDKYNKLKMKN